MSPLLLLALGLAHSPTLQGHIDPETLAWHFEPVFHLQERGKRWGRCPDRDGDGYSEWVVDRPSVEGRYRVVSSRGGAILEVSETPGEGWEFPASGNRETFPGKPLWDPAWEMSIFTFGTSWTWIDVDGDGVRELLVTDTSFETAGSISKIGWDRGAVHLFREDGLRLASMMGECFDLTRQPDWVRGLGDRICALDPGTSERTARFVVEHGGGGTVFQVVRRSAWQGTSIPVRLAQRSRPRLCSTELGLASTSSLLAISPGEVGLSWIGGGAGIAVLDPEGLVVARRWREQLLAFRPDTVVLARLRVPGHREVNPDPGDPYWRTRAGCYGRLGRGAWSEPPESVDLWSHLPGRALTLVESGLFDGIWLDEWDNDERLLQALRAAIGEDSLLVTDGETLPAQGRYLNGVHLVWDPREVSTVAFGKQLRSWEERLGTPQTLAVTVAPQPGRITSSPMAWSWIQERTNAFARVLNDR